MALESEGLSLDLATLTAGITAVFDDPNKGEYFVVEEGGALIACMLILSEWSDWRNGKVLWIHSVFVVPEHRGKRVFDFMYAQLVERVKTTAGLRGLRLYVDKRNARAIHVYERLGMTREHYDLCEWLA